VPAVQELSDVAVTYLTQSPQCRLLPLAEAPRPGDVVILRSAELKESRWVFQEVHGATWISSRLWASKYGGSVHEIKSPQQVFEDYFGNGSDPACLQRSPTRLTAALLEKCQSLYQVFRCESFGEFVDRSRSERQATTRFDQIYPQVDPFLWTIIHEQRAVENNADESGIAIPGSAYVSLYYHDPVRQYLASRDETVTPDLEEKIQELQRDSFLRGSYPLGQPAVPALPPGLKPDGDGYEEYTRRYGVVFEQLAEALALPSSSPAEGHLLRLLFLGMGSSQRASGEVRERFPELAAPNRSIPFE
jgi:hypothetical protein